MQANSEQKNKGILYFSGIVIVLCGVIGLVVTVMDGAFGRLPIAIGMILVGLLNILRCPAIVKIVGACIAIFGGTFTVGYYLVRLILG